MKEEYYFRIENFNDLFDIIEKKNLKIQRNTSREV